MKNTLNKGKFRYIIFKEVNDWYGVALEFNLVVQGDDKLEVMSELFNVVHGYLHTTRKFKLRDNVLNQKSDIEYELLWDKLNGTDERVRVKLPEKLTIKPSQVFNFGYTNNLAFAC